MARNNSKTAGEVQIRQLIDGTLATLAEMGVEVCVRSIFLNGVLFLPPDRAPSHLKAAAGRIASTAPARENSCKASTRASGSPTQPAVPVSDALQI